MCDLNGFPNKIYFGASCDFTKSGKTVDGCVTASSGNLLIVEYDLL